MFLHDVQKHCETVTTLDALCPALSCVTALDYLIRLAQQALEFRIQIT